MENHDAGAAASVSESRTATTSPKSALEQFLPLTIKGVSMNDGSISFGPSDLRIVLGYITNAVSFGDFVGAALNGGRRDFGAPDTAVTQMSCAQEIVRAANSHGAMLAALQQAEDYFDNRADVVDGDYGVPAPNKEMSILSEIRAAISKATGSVS